MKTELFKKVYIRSEDDLPKEQVRYFVYTKEYQERPNVFYWFPNNIECRSRWLNQVDWYLQPISEEEYLASKLPSEEEIKTYCDNEVRPFFIKGENVHAYFRSSLFDGIVKYINKLKGK